MHYGPIAYPCGHWAVRDVMRATLTGKVLHYKGAIVAPAQAGAYRACRPIQIRVMGTSLRWCDGVF